MIVSHTTKGMDKLTVSLDSFSTNCLHIWRMKACVQLDNILVFVCWDFLIFFFFYFLLQDAAYHIAWQNCLLGMSGRDRCNHAVNQDYFSCPQLCLQEHLAVDNVYWLFRIVLRKRNDKSCIFLIDDYNLYKIEQNWENSFFFFPILHFKKGAIVDEMIITIPCNAALDYKLPV